MQSPVFETEAESYPPNIGLTVDEKLDRIQATLDRYIELVEGMAEQVAPLMNSPMLRMFGGNK